MTASGVMCAGAARSLLAGPCKCFLLILLLGLSYYLSFSPLAPTDPSSSPSSLPPQAGHQVSHLVVVVCSDLPNYLGRQAIRDTWGTQAKGIGVRVFFLVGKRAMTKIDRLAEESDEHGDIIQEDFIDTYANLTLKSLALLRWAHQAFSGGDRWQHVLKTDDDVYINMPAL